MSTIPDELVALLKTCSETWDGTALLVTADWCQDSDYKSLEWLLRHLAKVGIRDHLLPTEKRGVAPSFSGIYLTGSRAYGTPRPDSDFDWIYFPTAKDQRAHGEMEKAADSHCEIRGNRTALSHTFRFGPVNLLVAHWWSQWSAWVETTRSLVARKPVTREEAVEAFKTAFRAARFDVLDDDEFSGDPAEDDYHEPPIPELPFYEV